MASSVFEEALDFSCDRPSSYRWKGSVKMADRAVPKAGLFEFLSWPLANNPSLNPRLASAASKIATTWRRFPLAVECYVCETINLLGGRVDMLWAGHLPEEIGRGFDENLRWRRIVLGGRDRKSELRRHRPYLPVSLLSARLRMKVGAGLAEDEQFLEAKLARYVRVMERLKPAVLVVTANYDPAIRLLALAAQSAHVPVALYGHGLSSPSYWLSLDDDLSSHFLCWTTEEADEYVRLGVDKDRVFTVGPLRVLGAPIDRAEVTQGILWLGSRLRSERYIPSLQRAVQIAASLGKPLIYRPHPLEDFSDVSDLIPQGWIADPRVPLVEQARRASVVLSGASTALVEVGMAGSATLYISDLLEATSPAIASHLSNAASWTTSCNDLSHESLCKAERRFVRYSYRDPVKEVSNLIAEKLLRY